jgi:precorrin-2 dehydrogenase / sirohydrochlorin ferrochelatase
MGHLQYPVCLDIHGRKCVVVGGGKIAARKVVELLRCGAHIVVVSPAVCDEMKRVLGDGVSHHEKEFEPRDLDGAFLAIAATDDVSTNELVAETAESERVLVNVVDVPDLCQFTAPAVVRRGLLLLTASTSGASPGLAGRFRRELDDALEPEWEPILEVLAAYRNNLLEQGAHELVERSDLLKQASRLELIDIYRSSGPEGLRAQLDSLVVDRSKEI